MKPALSLPTLLLLCCLAQQAQAQALPWEAPRQHRLTTAQMATAPTGTTWDLAPDLSPGAPQEPDLRRQEQVPGPQASADARLIWSLWRARDLEQRGEFARASLLMEVLAPQLPWLELDLTLEAARLSALAGQLPTAQEHLRHAQHLGATPKQQLATQQALALARKDPRGWLQQEGLRQAQAESLPPERCQQIQEQLQALPDAQLAPLAQDEAASALLRALPVLCQDEGWDKELARLRKKLPRAQRAALSPGAPEALRRANLQLARVHNQDALETLEALLKQKHLPPEVACEAPMRMAEALRRLRRDSKARPHFLDALKHCSSQLAQRSAHMRALRTRALYWGGLVLRKQGHQERATQAFQDLLREDPQARTADDALYHLHQMAQAQGRHRDAQALQQKLLADYPGGDMTRQLVFAPIEEALRQGDWAGALPWLQEAAALPPDPTYYSQGRLLYWLGRAHEALGDSPQAIQAWRRGWSSHPTAFYGQLCLWALYEHKDEAWISALPRPEQGDPVAFQVPPGAARGWIAVGDLRQAGELLLQDAGEDPQRLWLAAWLLHQAGDYPRSHNIARRRIPGFPETYGLPSRQTRALWEVAYPDPYGALVEPWAKARGVDPFLIRAIMREESSFHPGIVSWAGAVGLMQLMVPTARGNDQDVTVQGKLDREQLRRPEINVPIAARFLGTLTQQFEGHPTMIAAAYNAGPGNARKWRGQRPRWDIGLFAEDLPFREARNYSRRVTGSHGIYQWLWGEAAPRAQARRVP